MGNCCACLDDDQFVIVNKIIGKEVKQGPGCFSFCCVTLDTQNKVTLEDTQYIKVTHLDLGKDNERDDIIEIISGPCLYEQTDPYAVISQKFAKPKLTRTQYIVVTDERTGEKRVVGGPALFTPGPYDKCSKVRSVNVINNDEYIYVTHTDTGTIDIVEGPAKFIPGAHDTFSNTQKKIALEHDEYIKVVDKNSGVIRVEKGPSTVILMQYEEAMDIKQKACEINEHNGVYIKDTHTGNFELVKIDLDGVPFMYFPQPTHVIVEKREKIRLENTEVMVIVDREGKYNVMRGDGPSRAFFVPPYCHILEQTWSTDLAKSRTEVQAVTRFDTRPQFMDFEFLIFGLK